MKLLKSVLIAKDVAAQLLSGCCQYIREGNVLSAGEEGLSTSVDHVFNTYV